MPYRKLPQLLAFSRPGFPLARDHASDVARRDDLTLTLARIHKNSFQSRRDKTVIGMFDVETFAVGSVNGVRLEWRRALQASNFFGDHLRQSSSNPPLIRANSIGSI